MLLTPLHARPWIVRPVGDLSLVPPDLKDRLRRGVRATIHPETGGCVHTDLMDAEGGGLLPDPAVGVNEPLVEWVGRTDWSYETELDRTAAGMTLTFESLDTLAEIRVNGELIGTSQSEFIPVTCVIPRALEPTGNILQIIFTAPLRAAEELARTHGRPHNGDESSPPWPPFNMLRKCASNFCWDWGPRVATCGIAGPMRLGPTRKTMTLATAATPRPDGGWELTVTLRGAPPLDKHAGLDIEARLDGEPQKFTFGKRPATGEPTLTMTLANVRAWSPSDPALSTIEVVVHAWDDRCRFPLAAASTRFGFRHVTRGEDASLTLNGVRLFCKGANWIPEGLWPRDRTRDKLRARLTQAKAAGMNMLRVWGGGRYETDAFYELCDELGLMVWQDFMFACALYPEEEPWRTLVEREARHQVARLSRHPCIVLWCGGNENHWAYESWGFGARLKPDQTWGKGYWQDLLPKIVAELAPHTPYVPDSPWSPPPMHPNDPTVGDRHTWDAFGPDFRTLTPTNPNPVPRFCSEFGVQSPSNLETLAEASILPHIPRSAPHIPPTEAPIVRTEGANLRTEAPSVRTMAPNPRTETPSVRTETTILRTELPFVGKETPSGGGQGAGSAGLLGPALAARQRGPGGGGRWYDEFFAKAGIPAPKDFAEWHAAAQKMQADWLYLSLVWLRANWPACSGALLWQLNDAWPGLSWSIIDSAGREKPAYHAVRRAFADRLVETVPFGGVDHRVVINDTDEPWEVEPGWTVAARSVERRRAER